MKQELDKYIISDKESQLWEKVLTFLDSYKSLSSIQVDNFILNDIEFPTDYAKFKQAQVELIARWGRFVDANLELKELEIKIKLKEREIEIEDDELKKELLQIEKEKLTFQFLGKQRELKTINEEAKLFWEVYEKGQKFHNCSKEQIEELEKEYWAAKTMNMPAIFEERYGDEYMRKILGDEKYLQYLEMRQKFMGLLPRELIKGGVAKCLESDTKKQLGK